VISPVLFILALDQLLQQHDGKKSGRGVKVGKILRLKTLGYVDDVALIDLQVGNMTKRLTSVADGSVDDADMVVNMSKTFTQHVFKRDDIKVSKQEIEAIEAGYEHQCDFCERRFKTKRGMKIHKASCKFNYATTEESFPVEKIVAVFGKKSSRWYKVKYEGYDEPEWNREHLLLLDNCHDSISDFWAETELNPAKEYYPDPDGSFRCEVCGQQYKRAQDLKAHKTKKGHHEEEKKSTLTAKIDAKEEAYKKQQEKLPTVDWGDKRSKNAWHFKYLGSIFEAGGSQMKDVKTKVARARQRFGKMRHLWADKRLHLKLRLRLYKSCICSILTWGSEAWYLTNEVVKKLNGANAQMLCIITGKTPREEATAKTCSFSLINWIRSRRLQWVGHILRMGTDRKVKQAVFEMFKAPTEGDILMDAPKVDSWKQLLAMADGKKGREEWRRRVRELRETGHANFQIPSSRQKQPQPDSAPVRRTRQATAADAARYRRRDAHEGFFRQRTKAAKAELCAKQRSKPKRKKNPRPLTDKERRAFAREHYEAHHTNKYKPWETPPPISGHHQPPHTHAHAQLDSTIPITPPSVQSMLDYFHNQTQNHENLKNLD
jgi:hypothetical protein